MRIGILAAAAFAAAAFAFTVNAEETGKRVDVIEASFELAMRDMLSGAPEQAIPLLRGILGRKPELVRVRLELARAYFQASKLDKAREQFQVALSSPELPAGVRNNILRFLRRIDEQRGLQTNLSFALAAPTGATRSYDTSTVMVDLLGEPLPFKMDRPDVPKTSLQIEGSARKQWFLGEGLGGGRTISYLRGKGFLQDAAGEKFDRQEAETAMGVQLSWPRKTAYFEVISGATVANRELLARRAGLGGGYRARTASGYLTSVSGSIEQLDYKSNDLRDGHLISLDARLGRPFLDAGRQTWELVAERHGAGRDDYSYTSVEARLTHSLDVAGGYSLSASIYVEGFWQEGATPGLSGPRDEHEYGLDLRAEKSDLFVAGRYTPYAELGLSRRDSSIDAYSYKDARIEVGITSAF